MVLKKLNLAQQQLPLKWRIHFKLASLTYKVLHTGTPSYLSERLHPYVPSRTLRSSSSATWYVPHTNLHFGSRSFHIAAPTVWNYLPSTFRSSQTLNTFWNHPKVHFTSLFLIAPSDLSNASDSFYWMFMALNQILLLTYLPPVCLLCRLWVAGVPGSVQHDHRPSSLGTVGSCESHWQPVLCSSRVTCTWCHSWLCCMGSFPCCQPLVYYSHYQ